MIQLFKQNDYNLAEFENLEVSEEILDSFEIEDISLETVMFQSGYLTIKEVEEIGDNYFYHLSFQNIEVKKSFNDYILSNYFVNKSKNTNISLQANGIK